MACCIFDCMVERPRWPRGVLVGIATAVKLVPGIFIPYLWLTGRRRAAGVAVAAFGVCTLVGLVVTPADSWDFFHSKIFEPTSPTFFTNQSLEGILRRAVGGPWRLWWLPAVIVVVVYGMRAAIDASRAGDELRGVAITGLVSVLVSPISWIHHLVWVVPALASNWFCLLCFDSSSCYQSLPIKPATSGWLLSQCPLPPASIFFLQTNFRKYLETWPTPGSTATGDWPEYIPEDEDNLD